MFDMPGKIVEAMRDGMYDLAVLEHCECFDFSDLSTVSLPGDDMVFVSSPVLGLPNGNITPEDLFSQMMLTRKDGCCSRTLLEGNLRAIGKELSDFRSCVVIDDLHMILQLDSGLLRDHVIAGFRHHRNRTLVINSGCRLLPSSPQNYFIERIHACFGLPSHPPA
jgi:DNA-binding transcriptional LysR family regulator